MNSREVLFFCTGIDVPDVPEGWNSTKYQRKVILSPPVADVGWQTSCSNTGTHKKGRGIGRCDQGMMGRGRERCENLLTFAVKDQLIRPTVTPNHSR